jgi:signal peptidase I
MDDDQSMRDRVTGPHSTGARTGDGQADLDHGVTSQAPSPGQGSSGDGQAGPEQTAPADPDQSAPADPADPAAGKRRRGFWRELPVLIVVALVIALVIKTFVVQAFFIPSSSMEDTLLIGDKVLVNKVVYHVRPIRAGDIVVFDGAGSWDPVPTPARPSSDPIVRLYHATVLPLFRSIGGLFGTVPGQTDYIKRVIGVPGDHVACCNAAGQVTVNGVALHESSYLYPGSAPSEMHFHDVVPSGRLWVMGDNRLISDDSRLHTADPGAGTIPEDKVIGRAFMIVWPPNRWRILQIPATFGQPGVTKSAAAAIGAVGTQVGAAAPYLPLAGGFAVAFPVTWLQRRARLRRASRSRATRSAAWRFRAWQRRIPRRRAPRCR